MSNLGASLKKARETAGLPLERISADTRISIRFLLAIESEDFHVLPGGIFTRGFIRTYAERVGVDPEQAVADYDRMSAPEEPLEVLRSAEGESATRNDRNLYLIAAAVLVVLVAGYYVATRRSASPPDATAPPAVAQPSPPPASEPENVSTPIPAPAQETAPLTAPAASPPAQAASTLVLDVSARDLTWIRVSLDGGASINENLESGATRRFSAERSIDVTVGNAAGVSMKINGRDMGQLGAIGKVREFKITRENAGEIRG